MLLLAGVQSADDIVRSKVSRINYKLKKWVARNHLLAKRRINAKLIKTPRLELSSEKTSKNST